jgi:predicted nucleic acid-binding protein
MDIVVDTNILFQDFHLKSNKFDALFNYLGKTRSNLLFPEVVLQEAVAHYKRELQYKHEQATRAVRNLDKLTFTSLDHSINMSISEEVSKYEKLLERPPNLPKSANVEVLKNEPEHLAETVRRLVERVKPSSSDGKQGFRDILIWLSTLKYLRLNRERSVIFISKNVSDFGLESGRKIALDSELQNELNEENLKLLFYPSIEAFLENHIKKIDTISEAWIESILSPETIESIANPHLREEMVLFTPYVRRTNENFSDYLSFQQISSRPYIYSFSVYDVDSENVYLNIVYRAEVEVEIEVEKSSESSFDIDIYNAHTSQGQLYSYEYIYPEVELSFSAKIQEDDILDLQFEKWQTI